MPKIRGVKPDYWTDEDIVELSIPSRLLFIGLWNYACDNGHLQDKSKQIKMRIFPGDDVNVADLLRELDDMGCIVREGGWITVPNLTKHQRPDKRWWLTCAKPGCVRPEKDSQPKSHSAPRASTPGTRSGLAVGSVGTPGDGEGEGEVMVSGVDGDTSRERALQEAPRGDVVRICEHLADRIEGNGANRPTITAKWSDSARLMLDSDKRTEEEVHGAIDWCQDDEFWRANILSLPKLRERYDSLRLHAQSKPRSSGRQRETDDLFARAAQRMGVTGGQS